MSNTCYSNRKFKRKIKLFGKRVRQITFLRIFKNISMFAYPKTKWVCLKRVVISMNLLQVNDGCHLYMVSKHLQETLTQKPPNIIAILYLEIVYPTCADKF